MSKPREFWATQDLYKEDGIYVMAEDAQFIEEISKVEVPFKVIEKSAADKLVEALSELVGMARRSDILENENREPWYSAFNNAEQILKEYRGEE